MTSVARKSVHFEPEEESDQDDYFHDDEAVVGAHGDAPPESERDHDNDPAGASGINRSRVRYSSLMCPNCGSRDIEQQDASGASVCTSCGVVVEESGIVSSVEFVEGAGGASSMVGQFVSASSSKAFTGGGGGGARYGFGRDSRETTLANGRRRIQEVASRLRLNGAFIDAAHRLYSIAVERNFTQGRRTTHVVAACLYIACRQEKSQHMLIDFSDALQVNVYTLGICFLKFRRLLGLKLEVIDPALYVYRFAAHLELDEQANAVSLTALRLVARMKRDWMVAGRRPAGICAAALLIAARAHGFDKHQYDVTRILRVCGLTVTTRVKEFEHLPAAQLTLDQFHKVELPTEADPPVFTRNKYREARAKAIRQGNIELLASGALDDPMDGKRAKAWRNMTPKDKTVKFQELYDSLQTELSQNVLISETAPENDTGFHDTVQPPTNQLVCRATNDANLDVTSGLQREWKQIYPKSQEGKALLLPDDATPEELAAPLACVEAKLSLQDWKSQLPESVDKEIDGFFRTEDEQKQKEIVFNKLNKDYVEAQERKENARDDPDNDVATTRYKRRKKSANEDNTTEEQLLAAVSSRKVSRKINYDALSSIFDQSGSFATASTEINNEEPVAEFEI